MAERGKKEDSAPQSDPLRGDGEAGTKRRSMEGDDGSDNSAKKQKLSISLSKKTSSKTSVGSQAAKDSTRRALTKSPVAMKLGSKMKPKEPDIKPTASKSLAVSKVFCESSDDEEEEMPPEAKMRMKNLGRGTITSAGPNSFNKSKDGFINTGRAWRLKREEEIAKAEHEHRMEEMKQLEGWDV
ncbi:uncharacterized protein [Apostichopus japonicus]|uniref:uncharacterized protein isoform X2 n=1 Tax=Stichopus japonicus TaxID=307972 RepID=UPI003AB48E2A